MSPNAGYSENELLQMQQEAILRVREMQDRAQRTVENGWSGGSSTAEAPPVVPPAAPSPPQPQTSSQNQSSSQTQTPSQQPAADNNLLGNLLSGLGGPGAQQNLSRLFQGQTSSPLGGLMQWAGGDRSILIALLVLLMGEGADPTLLLALFYLVMFDDTPT